MPVKLVQSKNWYHPNEFLLEYEGIKFFHITSDPVIMPVSCEVKGMKIISEAKYAKITTIQFKPLTKIKQPKKMMMILSSKLINLKIKSHPDNNHNYPGKKFQFTGFWVGIGKNPLWKLHIKTLEKIS